MPRLISQRSTSGPSPAIAATKAQAADAGAYRVVITNTEGSVTSAVATLTVQLLQVSGLVALDEYAGLANDGVGLRRVTFKATDGAGQVLATWPQTLLFGSGSLGRGVAYYSLTNVPWGTAQISAKTAWHLRRRLPASFEGRSAAVDFTGSLRLIAGDLDDSNTVDLDDYARLAAAWYTLQDAADLDGNGLVDILDYFIMASHWLQSGDPE